MKYYELLVCSPDSDEGWHLSGEGFFEDGTELTLKNIWEYSKCQYVKNPLPVPLVIYKGGILLDCNHVFGIDRVVSKRVGEVIQSIAPNDIQRIPAKVEGDSCEWEVINILHTVKCVDYENSILDFHPPDHPRKPNKISSYFKLVIDPTNIGDHHIFRIEEYHIATIISETLLDALRSINATGLGVTQVYPNDGIVDEAVLRYLEVKKKLNGQ